MFRPVLVFMALLGLLVSACNFGGSSASFGGYDEHEFRSLSHRNKVDALIRIVAEVYPDRFAGAENVPGGLSRAIVWMKGDVPAELTEEFQQYEPYITIQGGLRFSNAEMSLRQGSMFEALIDAGYEVHTTGRRIWTLYATLRVDEPIPPGLVNLVRGYMEADLGPVLGELLEGDLVIEVGGGPIIPQGGDGGE